MMVIRGYRIGPLVRSVGKEALDDDILGLSARMAYFFFFSLFPLFLFAAPILSLVGDQESITAWILEQLHHTVPDDAMALMENFVRSVVFTDNAPGLMSVGALLALWAASNVFNNMMIALNRAYDASETRPFWKRRLIAMGMVLATGALVPVAAITMLAGPEIIRTASAWIGLENQAVIAWMVVQYTLAFALIVGTFWMIYYFMPNLRQDRVQVLAGAMVAAVLWIIATLGFRFYVTNFANYNATYGAVGGVIILLMWMYITMLVLLLGGEVNAELHHGTGRLEPRKGAVYAGRIVTTPQPDKSSVDGLETLQPHATS